MKTGDMIYDEICALLTRFEMDGTGENGDVSMGEFYDMLVEVQNRWGDTITSDLDNEINRKEEKESVYQIRKKTGRYSNDSPILFEGTKERAYELWERDGYADMEKEYRKLGLPMSFELLRAEYTLLKGGTLGKQPTKAENEVGKTQNKDKKESLTAIEKVEVWFQSELDKICGPLGDALDRHGGLSVPISNLEVINRAYEITIKSGIANSAHKFNEAQAEAILKGNITLDELYGVWVDSNDGIDSQVVEVVRDYLDEVVNDKEFDGMNLEHIKIGTMPSGGANHDDMLNYGYYDPNVLPIKDPLYAYKLITVANAEIHRLYPDDTSAVCESHEDIEAHIRDVGEDALFGIHKDNWKALQNGAIMNYRERGVLLSGDYMSLPGVGVKHHGIVSDGYTIERVITFDDNTGFALAFNRDVTAGLKAAGWRFHVDEDGERAFHWGRRFSDYNGTNETAVQQAEGWYKGAVLDYLNVHSGKSLLKEILPQVAALEVKKTNQEQKNTQEPSNNQKQNNAQEPKKPKPPTVPTR